MLPKRLHISQSASDKLRILKGRTGLTPNIVCRIAFVLSLNEGPKGGRRKVDQSGSEFNSATLFGEHTTMFESLFKQVHGVIDSKLVAQMIASHIDDGLARLTKAKSLSELVIYASPVL
ncbi:MAG: DNA sulfur modification protein DndE [Polaromonas sp.]|uniref:DNA sulfur modification protein DndE n=1 Tax=Polaromonas sp. TaxID=1869339 RepID=UPI00272F22AB|nr:DNA sulfur modification protein DndE [Polaromonas sp.]MDP2450751.1 DNA sulfur modification protein DndE [Polaromonas sp.]MDP3246256.1 DNA sulfur modification protein DndE [Polaromonas sp.]MDP3754902.1 DNA sulfur modification protein DndE [Polaromonas sp.]